MNRDKAYGLRAAITLEAAIVLPLFIVCILAVLYLMKVMYIQDQIHSAMTRTAHQMAVAGFVAERTELTDLQQEIYAYGTTSVKKLESSVTEYSDMSDRLVQNATYLTDLSLDTVKSIGTEQDIGLQASVLVIELPGRIEAIYTDTTAMLDGIDGLMEESVHGLVGYGSMEIMTYVNGLVTVQATKSVFADKITQEQLEEWGVEEGIDFSSSHFMLEDDTIELVAVYEVSIPFIEGRYGRIPICQTVKARAFTGAYDYGSNKRYSRVVESEDDSQMLFFVSTKADVRCYHVHSCLRKDLQEGDYTTRVAVYGQSVCSYCAKHHEMASSGRVWYVSDSSKLHYTRHCTKVWAESIKALTKEEAEAQGYVACKKKGCSHEMLMIEDSKSIAENTEVEQEK